MSRNIFSKDEEISSSPPIVGFKILEFMKKKNKTKISIFDIAYHFKEEKWFSLRSIYFSMIFLFSLNIIEFQQSYIILVAKC